MANLFGEDTPNPRKRASNEEPCASGFAGLESEFLESTDFTQEEPAKKSPKLTGVYTGLEDIVNLKAFEDL